MTDVGSAVLFVVHLTICLALVLGLAWLGRVVARWLRQPEVIGEITGGLLVGPALRGLAGPVAFGVLLPGDVLGALKLFGAAGLTLLLVGLTNELHRGAAWPRGRVVCWIVFGALVPSLVTGTLLAGWVLLSHDPAVRGPAPLPAFVLFVAVALSITAVPVLARILTDRGLTNSTAGRLALTGAIVLDALGWVLLSIVVGLDSGSAAGTLRVIGLMAGAALLAVLLRRLLRTQCARAAARHFPRVGAVLIGATAVVAALGMAGLGLSSIFCGVLFGLAVPAGESREWAAVVAPVTKAGLLLVPVFFVAAGVTVFTAALGKPPWTLLVLAAVLGIVGKVGGGYLGARLGGLPRRTSVWIGVLLNTRGLTELIVIQIGYSTGIATAPMFLALVVMALATTACTGPLLSLLDRLDRRAPEPAPAPAVT